jgi:pyruvate/2-oxoglutarate dehydrogenase complex dihydrolipoamide dehydrogenase (E3) component
MSRETHGRTDVKYDAIIIGTGQSGAPLSWAFADLGWQVAVIEKGFLGGTCINTGCTPTKTMVHRAQVAHYARDAARWGVEASGVRADLAKIVAQKNKVVHDWRDRKEKGYASRPNARLYRGHAQFVGPHSVQVGDQVLESDKIFIDTGGRPEIPPIPGLDSVPYLTNESILDLTDLPKHLIILGAGYIGLEFGQMFARFGSEVTIVHNNAQIVAREDPEVAAELQRALESDGVRFLLSAQATRVEKKDGSIAVSVQTGTGVSAITGSHLLVATGRVPNTGELGLQRAGVETDARGYIKVNGRLETNVSGIWALGDVKGGPAFTHISYNDFQIVHANIIQGQNLTIDHRIVPYSLFTDPQLGRAGLTEKEARAKGYKLKIGKLPMSHVARAIERDETAGLMKIIVDATNDRILGATVLSSEGGELIHILYTLMLADVPYTLLKGAVYIHPTLAEGMFFLLNDVKPVDQEQSAARSA